MSAYNIVLNKSVSQQTFVICRGFKLSLILLQEIIADTGIEIPDVSVAKQLMRRHVRNLLNVLNPRERRVIRLRFGIEDGKPKSLSEIGNMFGLSKERVRQLENRALYRLRQSLGSEALGGYVDLLV